MQKLEREKSKTNHGLLFFLSKIQKEVSLTIQVQQRHNTSFMKYILSILKTKQYKMNPVMKYKSIMFITGKNQIFLRV